VTVAGDIEAAGDAVRTTTPPGWSAVATRESRTARRSEPFRAQIVEATSGFEPLNRGFADLRVKPLHHVAWKPAVAADGISIGGPSSDWLALEDSNLGSRIQSPLSYH
jgi:hypothetical protein